MNSIVEHAGALGLFATANALADAKIEPDHAPRDARLEEPPADDLKRILGQMARRGADPALVTALWATLENRPLERALVAVDVLAQALWAPRDPLLAELRAAAASLGDARPPAGEVGIDLNAHPATALIEQHRAPSLATRSIIDLLALAFGADLGVLAELERRKDALVTRPATRESVHAFARLAMLARLPTWASVTMDWLMRGLGYRAPALDLCEALFDAGVAHKIPGTAIQPGDFPEREQRDVTEYLVYRAHLGVGDSDTANALLLQTMAERPRWTTSPGVRVDVVRGHLGTLYGRNDVNLSRIEAACAEDRLWRYAAKVRSMVAAKRAPSRAVDLFHAYVTGFGQDFEMARTVISLVPENIKRQIARIVAREAYYVPHEPAPWRLLGLLFDVARPVAAELDARLRAQSTP